ncbi:MAG: diacylglycerol kinase family lipid kinase [Syntrophomonadaceae bacterium]|nr:diacylglycerol kinase family lipid kinase [Syntrophomonadaceae bacterium]
MAYKTVFIVNPESRAGITDRLWHQREMALKKQGITPEVRITTGPLHATRLTAQALSDGFDHIVSVGGDGTLNEVVNGFFKDGALINPEARLSAVSFATGGDLARILPLQGEPEDINVLLSDAAHPFKCDVIRADFTDWNRNPASRYFINVSDVGIGCETVIRVNNKSKALGGLISFFSSAMASLLTAHNIDMEIIADGEVFFEGPVTMAVIANGRYFGSGMYASPTAELDDGLMDLTVFKDFSRTHMMFSIPKIYNGKYLDNPRVGCCKAKTVEFKSHSPFHFEMDGETPGLGNVKYQILPGAMNMLLSQRKQ